MTPTARPSPVHRSIGLFALVFLLASCTITQQVNPVSIHRGTEICVIEDPEVRAGFVEEVRRTLASSGYRVKMLPPAAQTSDCEVVITYTARWSWDLTIYMSYARIEVFKNGAPAGDAVYDSTRGGGNMGKFIDAEPKIRELVTQLLPTQGS